MNIGSLGGNSIQKVSYLELSNEQINYNFDNYEPFIKLVLMAFMMWWELPVHDVYKTLLNF